MRRWLVIVIGVWVVAALAGAVFGGQVFDRAASVSELGPHAESMRAKARLQELAPEGPLVIAILKGREAYDPELVASVERVTKALQGKAKVETLYNTPGGQVGADGATMVRAELLDPSNQDSVMEGVVATLRTIDAPTVLIGGEPVARKEFADRAIRDAAVGEAVALVILAILLWVLFRRVKAVLITLGVALISVTVTLLALRILSEFVTVSEFALNVVTLLGLGLTVDYALLLLTWEKARKAVLISGAAVSLTLLGLLAVAEPLLRSMALGGLVAAVVSTAAALTLVPFKGWEVRGTAGLLQRLARFALGRPGPTALLTAGLLVLLALPFLSVRLGNSDASSLPARSEARRVAEEIRQNFEFGRAEPVTVIVEGDSAGAEMRDYLNALNRREIGVARLQLRLGIPVGTTVIDLTPNGRGEDVVRAVRAQPLNRAVLVGGPAAEVVDYRDAVLKALPLMLAVLMIVLLALLFVLTGSLVIPVKALILNLLPLAATLGVLALFFGHLDLTTPVLLFVFMFGLSMDYEVFLLARISDEYATSRDNDRAVLAGLTKTGPVVTAAAACLMVVFLGFAFGELTPVREIGVGMAVALALDVTIVRGLLLPATMKLLGAWNWWPHPRSVWRRDA